MVPFLHYTIPFAPSSLVLTVEPYTISRTLHHFSTAHNRRTLTIVLHTLRSPSLPLPSPCLVVDQVEVTVEGTQLELGPIQGLQELMIHPLLSFSTHSCLFSTNCCPFSTNYCAFTYCPLSTIAPSQPIESSPPIAPSPHSSINSNPQHDNEEPQSDNEQPPHLYGRPRGKVLRDGKT
ncbi:uncharacterized protein G2W53_044610 [Senna tora]|uniref:Uncharacterized protein n=1 Tax=Senna tora TaxID=362788 RepID=A0A834VXR5_9FABA|nr:uncharacterized protein G2W53_044610 [Senna tora]